MITLPSRQLKKYWNFLIWALGLTPEARCRRILKRIRLRPGDIAIDCGANVGDMTMILAEGGANVHAFEPNPHAFEVLRKRFEDTPHVTCYNAAVGSASGRMALYLHENSRENEVYWSNGSSLLRDKPNVSSERSIEVEVIDLVTFLKGLGKPVRVLKIDIEGAEVDLMEHFIDEGCLPLAQKIFVEVHDAKIPSLVVPTARLRERLAKAGADHVSLDWV